MASQTTSCETLPGKGSPKIGLSFGVGMAEPTGGSGVARFTIRAASACVTSRLLLRGSRRGWVEVLGAPLLGEFTPSADAAVDALGGNTEDCEGADNCGASRARCDSPAGSVVVAPVGVIVSPVVFDSRVELDSFTVNAAAECGSVECTLVSAPGVERSRHPSVAMLMPITNPTRVPVNISALYRDK